MKKIALLFVFFTTATIINAQQTFKVQIDYFGLVTSLMEYKSGISESFRLTQSWVFIDKKTDTPDKIKLKEFCQTGIDGLNERIKSYDYLLDTTDLVSFLKIKEEAVKLVEMQRHIMSGLYSFNSYDDPAVMFEILPPVEEGGILCSLTNSIIADLDKLILKKTIEYVALIGKQSIDLSSSDSLKARKIKQLLYLLNASSEIKEILTINNKSSALDSNYYEKNIYEILVKKYDKYYTINEIDDLTAFYKTKTGRRMIKVSQKMMIETLNEIMNTLK